MSKAWDTSILKKLKTLVGKGLSTSEIGKRLGLSKNAVVGKLHRLGWNAKAADADVAVEKPKAVAKKTATLKKAPKVAPKIEKKPAKPTKEKKSVSIPAKKTSVVKPAPKPVAKKEDEPVEKKNAVKKTGGHAIAEKGISVHQRMVQHALEMANLKPNQCRWPIGDPDSEEFHFCGHPVFVGKPYCYEHCKQAYQFTPPKKK